MEAPSFTAETYRNQLVESANLAEWSSCPDVMVAYYNFPCDFSLRLYRQALYPSLIGATVSTWLSSPIGDIIRARVYTNNIGARIVSMRVRGSNGAEYHGRASWDGGNVVRLRRVK